MGNNILEAAKLWFARWTMRRNLNAVFLGARLQQLQQGGLITPSMIIVYRLENDQEGFYQEIQCEVNDVLEIVAVIYPIN